MLIPREILKWAIVDLKLGPSKAEEILNRWEELGMMTEEHLRSYVKGNPWDLPHDDALGPPRLTFRLRKLIEQSDNYDAKRSYFEKQSSSEAPMLRAFASAYLRTARDHFDPLPDVAVTEEDVRETMNKLTAHFSRDQQREAQTMEVVQALRDLASIRCPSQVKLQNKSRSAVDYFCPETRGIIECKGGCAVDLHVDFGMLPLLQAAHYAFLEEDPEAPVDRPLLAIWTSHEPAFDTLFVSARRAIWRGGHGLFIEDENEVFHAKRDRDGMDTTSKGLLPVVKALRWVGASDAHLGETPVNLSTLED